MSAVRKLTHPVARGFDRVAAAYERGRPGYPPAAVRYLVRSARLGRGRTVVELGSGTGKLTRLLRPSGAAVVAVEPSGPMRGVFERAVPGVLVVPGAAEAIPLQDGVADAVVAAQAFHWFRPRRALREIARVLRPGGTLLLVWNVRDERVPLARAIQHVIDRIGGPRPRRWERWEAAFEDSELPFGPLRLAKFRHVVAMTPTAVVEHALSVSRVAVLPPALRRRVAREVQRLLAERGDGERGGLVRFPTVTEVYRCRRRARRGRERGRRKRRNVATRRSARTSPA